MMIQSDSALQQLMQLILDGWPDPYTIAGNVLINKSLQ